MNTKVLTAALVGAIFYFLLGWLVYGIILMDQMEEGMNDAMRAVYRSSDSYVYWAFGVSNFAYALLLSIAFNKFGVRSFGKGAMNGAWIGFLIAISFDFGMYAQTTMFDLSMIGMDAVMATIMGALVGGVVGWMLGMGKKQTATA